MDIIKYEQPKAVDARRELASNAAVCSALNVREREILTASAGRTIAETDETQYYKAMRQLIKFIAIDTGYNAPKDANMWVYVQTRIAEVIKKYFGTLSVNDIKLAFELLIAGELDAYLPKDSNGNPENKHYQQFNAAYFSRVLKAYQDKQNDVIGKCYDIAARQPLAIESKTSDADFDKKNREVFERYKTTGELEFYVGGEIFVYDWLRNAGIIDTPATTQTDRNAAIKDVIRRVRAGIISEDRWSYISRHKDESDEIKECEAMNARRRVIKEAFDKIIKDKIKI